MAVTASAQKKLVQYVVVRSDLIHTMSWPLGAVITQACHATTAAIHLFYSDPDTQEYLADLDNMHKVVLEVVHIKITSSDSASVASGPLLIVHVRRHPSGLTNLM